MNVGIQKCVSKVCKYAVDIFVEIYCAKCVSLRWLKINQFFEKIHNFSFNYNGIYFLFNAHSGFGFIIIKKMQKFFHIQFLLYV